MINMNLLKIMNRVREFDKDEDGKLSEAELREIMVSLGEEPVTEQEFKHFIKVGDTQPYLITTSYCLLTCFEVSIILLLLQCFPVDAEGLLEYEGFCKTVCGKKKVK